MAFPEEARFLFNSVVGSPEAEAAFRAGYTAGIDPSSEAKLGSSRDIPHVIVREDGAASDGEWFKERNLAYGNESILIDDPAFVLGATLGKLSMQHSMERI